MAGVRWFFIACLGMLTADAHAFIDPPVVVPASPTAATPITIEIRNGLCDRIYDYTITSPLNPVELIIHRIPTQLDPLCINPIQTAQIPIGTLPAGTHQLRLLFQIRESMGQPPNPPYLWLELSVQVAPAGGSEVMPVHTLSRWPAIGLLAILVLLGAWARRAITPSGAIILTLIATAGGGIPTLAHAVTHIEVLLSAESEAPTPEQVINWGFSSPPAGPPPLPALAAEPFLAINYFIPERFRAQGDFKAVLDAYPDSPQALLERFVVVTYPDGADIGKALNAYSSDPYVITAAVMEAYDFNSVALQSFGFKEPSATQADQWHLEHHNVPQAWQHNPGHALIAFVDSGLQWDHPNLRAFNGNTFLGGNFLTAGSFDLVYPPLPGDSFPDNDVDERKPIPATHAACDIGNGLMVPTGAGHGTHASGLSVARATFAGDITGVCKHCGLYMMKSTEHECNQFSSPPEVFTFLAANHLFASVQIPIRIGAQIVNMSFSAPATYICQDPNHALRTSCLVLEIAQSRDTIVVAASGNERQALNFPAADPRVVAAGGIFQTGVFWDESPGGTTNCPVIPGLPIGTECGSNFTTIGGGPKQELTAGSRDVISTFYTGATWNSYVRCTDDADDIGTPNDGISPCTGTSMSAPIVSGILGLLRSTNPLVRTGDPEQSVVLGLRNVLATTTDRTQAGLAWDTKFGYGRPDAAAAVRQVLGRVAGTPVKNRATPLFGLYGSNAKDYAQTTSPQ
jgi:serine protease